MKIVGIEQTDLLSIRTENVEHANRRMVNGQILSLLELDTVEFSISVENAVLKHALHFKIRLHQILIDLVFFGTHFFRVVLPVPRFGLAIDPILLHESHDVVGFFLGLGKNPRCEIPQHFKGGLRFGCHLVFKCKGGMARIP